MAFGLTLCVSTAGAENALLASVEEVITKALPSGWKIVEHKNGEIPWGHHWCDKYSGVTGTKLVARGTLASRSRFLGQDDQWRDVVVGGESLDIYIMPGSYRESRMDWFCFSRPIQPSTIVELGDIRLYARPSHHSSPAEKRIFDEQLSASKAVESPESPWNDPSRLSWKTWESDLRAIVGKMFARGTR